MGDSRYALGKLTEIVGDLATGAGDARERVFVAARALIAINADDFPPELGKDFSGIAAELERRRKPEGGYRWTNATAARIASRLYDLHHNLENFLADE